jgi:hypothetical protein
MSRLPTVLVVGGGAKALAALHALQPFMDPDSGPIVQVGWVTNTSGGPDDLEVCSHLEAPLLEAYAATEIPGTDAKAAAAPAADFPHVTMSSAECKMLAPLGVFHQKLVRIVEPEDVQYSAFYACSVLPDQFGGGNGNRGRPTSGGKRGGALGVPAAAAVAVPTSMSPESSTNTEQQRIPVEKMRPIALLSDGTAVPFDRLVSAAELTDLLPSAEVPVKGGGPILVPGLGDVCQHNPGPRWDSLNKPLYQGEKPSTRSDSLFSNEGGVVLSGGGGTGTGGGSLPVSQKRAELFHLLDAFDQDSLVSWLGNVEPVEFEAPKRRRNGGAGVHGQNAMLMSGYLSQDSSLGGGAILNTVQDVSDEGSSDDEEDDDDESSVDESEDGQESEDQLPLLHRPHQVHVVVAAGSEPIASRQGEKATQEEEAASTRRIAEIPPAIAEYFQSGNVSPAAVASCTYCWSFIHCLRFPAAVTTLSLKLSLEVGEGAADTGLVAAAHRDQHRQEEDYTPLYEEEEPPVPLSSRHAADIFAIIQKHNHATVAPHIGTEIAGTTNNKSGIAGGARSFGGIVSSIPVTILSLNVTTMDLSAMGTAVTLATIGLLVDTFIWKGKAEQKEEGAEVGAEDHQSGGGGGGGPVHSTLRSLVLDNVSAIGHDKSKGLRCLVTGLLKQAQYHRDCIQLSSAQFTHRWHH